MESFFPFIREWTERVTIVIVTMLGISQIFLAEFLLYSLFLLRARQSVWGKSVARAAARPMATLGDDCLDSELIVLISGLSNSNYVVRDLSPLSPASCVHSVVPIVPCPTSKVHKSGRVERAMERVASLPEIGSCR